MITSDRIAHCTALIVAGYCQGNPMPIDQIPEVVNTVLRSIAVLDRHPDAIAAIQADSTINDHTLVCMECGREVSMLKRHIRQKHDLTPTRYRIKYSLPHDYPMTSANYSAMRRELALARGLGGRKAA